MTHEEKHGRIRVHVTYGRRDQLLAYAFFRQQRRINPRETLGLESEHFTESDIREAFEHILSDGAMPEAQTVVGIEATEEWNSATVVERVAALNRVNERACAVQPTASHVSNLTDVGNGERLAARHADDIRYVYELGSWFIWDGKRWIPDDAREIERRAKDTVRSMLSEAARHDDDEARMKVTRHALASEANSRIKAMIERARSEKSVGVAMSQLDSDPWALTVDNGTVDLRTGELRAHCREQYATKLAPVKFDPNARCPQFLGFLERVLAGDSQLIGFVQCAIGYTMTGLTSEQVLFLLSGSGANGKTTLLEVLRTLLGDYAVTAAFTTFVVRRQDGAREDVARLDRARLVISSEAGDGQRFDEALIKNITGGDSVVARQLYKPSFEFRPQFKLWLAANHRPAIRDTSEAIWRRIRVIPFSVQIPPTERDPLMGQKLCGELSGILQWALDGVRRWRAAGLGLPERVHVATNDYRTENDVFGRFIDECCAAVADHAERASDLFGRYKRWCAEAGEHQASQTAFGRWLNDRGVLAEKRGRGSNRITYRIGLQLRSPELGANGRAGDGWEPQYASPSHNHRPSDLPNDEPKSPQPSPGPRRVEGGER